MDLLRLTNHDDRVAIDKEIESWTGVYCDDAIDRRLISENEFKKIVRSILARKKKSKETTPLVA
jgi:homospermidine synthase